MLGAELCSVKGNCYRFSKSSTCNSEHILLGMYRKISIKKLHVVIKFSLQMVPLCSYSSILIQGNQYDLLFVIIDWFFQF